MTTTTGRTFGLEFECVGIYQRDAEQALMNAGINVRTASYSGTRYDVWQVKTDGSLSSGRSAEIVSPILSWGNSDHVRQIETVTRVLRESGARVDTSCGLHCHVGASDLTKDEVRGVVGAYRSFQASIDANVSSSRVNTRWARRIPSADSSAFRYWMDEFENGRLSYENRYHAVNLNKFHEFGTIEYRQRNGSLNARKALTWAGLVLSITKYGAEYEQRENLPELTAAGDTTDGVWNFLNVRQSLDAHADLWRTGGRPIVTPEAGSFARLLLLQGIGA